MRSQSKLRISKIKVIAGVYKNSNVFFYDEKELRPSLNRHRERLFAWLTPFITGSKVLDLFAGSGILAIEALSRGAKSAHIVEKNTQSVAMIKQNLERLKINSAQVHSQNALAWLDDFAQSNPTETLDLIFLDPPFEQKLRDGSESMIQTTLLYRAIVKITAHKLLSEQGLLYLEIPHSRHLETILNEILKLDATYELHKFKEAKNLCLVLIQKQGSA